MINFSWKYKNTLSEWFSPSGFFQGHWPKILVFCVFNGVLIFISCHWKDCLQCFVWKFLFISSTLFFWKCHKQWYKFYLKRVAKNYWKIYTKHSQKYQNHICYQCLYKCINNLKFFTSILRLSSLPIISKSWHSQLHIHHLIVRNKHFSSHLYPPIRNLNSPCFRIHIASMLPLITPIYLTCII